MTGDAVMERDYLKWRQRAQVLEREVAGLRAELAAAKEVAAEEIAHLRAQISDLTYDTYRENLPALHTTSAGYGYV